MTVQVTLLYLKISPLANNQDFENYLQQNDRLLITDKKKIDQPLKAVYLKPVRLTWRMKLFKARSSFYTVVEFCLM